MTLSRRARRALIIAFAVAAYLALAVFLQSRQGKRPPRDPHAAVLDADYLSVTYKAQTCADEGIASDKCEAIVARDAREAAGRTDDLKGWESCFYDLWWFQQMEGIRPKSPVLDDLVRRCCPLKYRVPGPGPRCPGDPPRPPRREPPAR